MAKSSGSSGNDQLINLQAQQLAAQVANWAAQLEFQKERMRLLELPEMQGKLQVDIDKLAWQKAQDTWERAIKEATLTGKYNGQDTTEWLTQQAQMTGVLNGQQTLQGKLTDAQVAQMNNSMRLANDQFVTSTTGYFNGQKTFDREKFEAGQAQDAWKFLSTLTGPSNAFKQAKAIGNIPGGLQGIMGAWAGQYSPSGFGAVGSGGQATMEGLLGGGGPGSPYSYYPPPGGLAGPGTANGYPGMGGYPYGGGPPGPGLAPGGGGGAPAPGGAGAPTAGTPTGGTPAAPAPGTGLTPGTGAAPTGQLDAGFYIWLAHHGVTPGDPAMAYRMEEFKANYASLPQADHQSFIDYGLAHPAEHQFDLSGWASIPGLPAYTLSSTPTPAPAPAPVPSPTLPPPPGSPPPTHPPTLPGAPTGNEGPPGGWAPINAGERPPEGMDIDTWLKARQGDQQGSWHQDAQGMFIFTPTTNMPVSDLNGSPRLHASSAGSGGYPEGSQQQAGWGYGAQNPYSYQGAGVQAPANEWNYSLSPTGSVNVYPPGVSSNSSTPDISSPYAMSPGAASNLYTFGANQPQGQPASAAGSYNPGTGTYAPGTGGTTAPAGSGAWSASSMPLPNQINARNYNNSYQYQRELGWAGYEDAGWDKGLAQEAFARSLPKTAGPKKGSFAF